MPNKRTRVRPLREIRRFRLPAASFWRNSRRSSPSRNSVRSRGLIGFRTEFLTETRGTGIAHHGDIVACVVLHPLGVAAAPALVALGLVVLHALERVLVEAARVLVNDRVDVALVGRQGRLGGNHERRILV